jgi:hypothetical protein
MPMRRPFRASRVDDTPELLPPELEARVAALEAGASGADFDAVSWVWMMLFGIVLPVSLILLGW